MPRQIKITFSLSAELKQQILNYCKEKSKDGITFTPSDLSVASQLPARRASWTEEQKKEIDDTLDFWELDR